jgi:ABC-2 type transport system permease protein
MSTVTRIFTIVWGELLHLRRNKVSIAFLILIPTMSIVAMNYAFGQVTNLPICLSDQDDGKAAQTLISFLRGSSRFKVAMEGNITDVDARKFVIQRQVRVAVIIPKGFSRSVDNGSEAHVKVMLDATDESVYLPIEMGLSEAIQNTIKEVVQEKLGGNIATTIIDVQEEKVYGENLRAIDQRAPILIAFFITYICMSACSLAIVREKVEGTIQRLLLTPTRGSEIILGKVFYGVIVAVGEVSLLLLLGVGIYKIKVVGDIFLVFSLGLLIGLGGIGMGLASSAVSKNELEALLWQSAYIVPALLVSGLIYPIEAMSPFLQTLANLVPMTQAIRALKAVMAGGLGLSSIIVEVFALSIFAALMLLLGVLIFRRETIAKM